MPVRSGSADGHVVGDSGGRARCGRRFGVLCLSALFLAVLVSGLLYAWHLGEGLRYPDERDYVALAHGLRQDGVYALVPGQPTAYRPPGYPLLLAVVAGMADGLFLFRAVNMLALAGCILLVSSLVSRAHGLRAGLWAALLAALYPLNLYVAGTLYPQAVAAAGLLLLLLGWEAWRRDGAWREGALLGVLSAALVLLVPAFLWVCGLIPLLLMRRRGVNRLVVAGWLLALVLTLLPWTLRNQRVFGEFVLVSTNTGINLLLGNSAATRPDAGVNVDLSAYREDVAGLDEVARDRQYKRYALEWITGHPRQALGLYLRKVLNYFNYRNQLFVAGEASPWRDGLLLVSYGPLLVLVALRVLGWRRLPLTRLEWVLVLLYVLNGAFQAVFFTRIRHRAPFDYLLVCLAAPLVDRWVDRWRGGREVSRP